MREMECWSNGVLECWVWLSPSLHDSTTPVLQSLCGENYFTLRPLRSLWLNVFLREIRVLRGKNSLLCVLCG